MEKSKQESNDIYKKQLGRWAELVVLWLILLQTQRLLFAFAFVRDFEWSEFAFAWFMGLRFDLLVIGYYSLLTLPVFYFMGRGWNSKTLAHPYQFMNGVFLLSSAFVFMIDSMHFLLFQDRVSLKTLIGFLWVDIDRQYLASVGGFLFFFNISTTLILYIYGLRRVRSYAQEPLLPWSKIQLFLLALLFGLAARGSLANLHLDLRHTEVSKNRTLNLMVVPSWYALDQAIRLRR